MKWRNNLLTKKIALICCAVIFAGTGTVALLASHATVPNVNVETESGNLSNLVGVINDQNASGGSAIQFGAVPMFGAAVLIPAYKFALLRNVVTRQTSPNYAAWLKVKAAADAALKTAPSPPAVWQITASIYTDPAAYEAQIKPLTTDSYNAYMLGLAYQITSNNIYAIQADKIIQAWSSVQFLSSYTTFSVLPWDTYFSAMIYGADMIRSSSAFSPADQTAFNDLLTRSLSSQMTFLAYKGTNNQGVWGVVCVMSTAVYLKDKTLFDTMVARYKAIQDVALDANSVPTQEIHRQGAGQGDGSSGLAYSNFVMMAMTYAAEVANTQGIDVYNYISPNSANLHDLYTLVASWSLHPDTFPYNTSGIVSQFYYYYAPPYEILNGRWPDVNAQALLNAYRPVGSAWTVQAPTFIWGDSLGQPY